MHIIHMQTFLRPKLRKIKVVCSSNNMRSRISINALILGSFLPHLSYLHIRTHARARAEGKKGRYALQQQNTIHVLGLQLISVMVLMFSLCLYYFINLPRLLFQAIFDNEGKYSSHLSIVSLCLTWIICLSFLKDTCSFHASLPALHADLTACNIHSTIHYLWCPSWQTHIPPSKFSSDVI